MMSNNDLILRDTLALERTSMANQRTLLSFARTGLYLVVTGAGIIEFSDTARFYWLAWVLVVLGLTVAIVGGWNYWRMTKKIACSYQ